MKIMSQDPGVYSLKRLIILHLKIHYNMEHVQMYSILVDLV